METWNLCFLRDVQVFCCSILLLRCSGGVLLSQPAHKPKKRAQNQKLAKCAYSNLSLLKEVR